MLTFHGDPELKAIYLARVRAHERADRIVQGTYWDQDTNGVFRGCAVGCTLHDAHSDDLTEDEGVDTLHDLYPGLLGIPVWLAELEESIFEGMAIRDARVWPRRFLEAVPVGVDLDASDLDRTLAVRRIREALLPLLPQLPPQAERPIRVTLAALEGQMSREEGYSAVWALRARNRKPRGSESWALYRLQSVLTDSLAESYVEPATGVSWVLGQLGGPTEATRADAWRNEADRVLEELGRLTPIEATTISEPMLDTGFGWDAGFRDDEHVAEVAAARLRNNPLLQVEVFDEQGKVLERRFLMGAERGVTAEQFAASMAPVARGLRAGFVRGLEFRLAHNEALLAETKWWQVVRRFRLLRDIRACRDLLASQR